MGIAGIFGGWALQGYLVGVTEIASNRTRIISTSN